MKTKLGISVALMGAGLYCMGLVSSIALVILALYIFLKEDEQWLKRTAVKVIAIVSIFALASAGLSILTQADSFIYYLAKLFGGSFSVTVIDNLLSLISIALTIAQKVLLLLGAIKALELSEIKFDIVDKILEKHM